MLGLGKKKIHGWAEVPVLDNWVQTWSWSHDEKLPQMCYAFSFSLSESPQLKCHFFLGFRSQKNKSSLSHLPKENMVELFAYPNLRIFHYGWNYSFISSGTLVLDMLFHDSFMPMVPLNSFMYTLIDKCLLSTYYVPSITVDTWI